MSAQPWWRQYIGDVGEASRQSGDQVLERQEKKTKEPDQHQVVLLNDDYTTMEFVMDVLEHVFHKSPAEAYRIMLLVHTQGRGVCGVYTWEVAETKAAAVVAMAQQAGYPLRAVVEDV
ncbi:MAG: ATP-dependent Clp protease adapter ClpS [Acidobacteria bacterium]|nr:ATP-dependent Clp protease adapter ClpS [Acidobacteriota bacterium]